MLGISTNRAYPSANPRNPKFDDIVDLSASGRTVAPALRVLIALEKAIRCTPQVRTGGGILVTGSMSNGSYIGAASDLVLLMPVFTLVGYLPNYNTGLSKTMLNLLESTPLIRETDQAGRDMVLRVGGGYAVQSTDA